MRRLHRSIGAGAAIFVFFMVLTGLVFNHSNGLGLDQRHVSQPFLLGWYGLGKPDKIQSYAVGDEWLSFAGSQLYLNDKSVATISDGVGAVSVDELLSLRASSVRPIQIEPLLVRFTSANARLGQSNTMRLWTRAWQM